MKPRLERTTLTDTICAYTSCFRSGHLRREQGLPVRLAGRRHGRQGAAVEAVLGGDDLVGASTAGRAPPAGELDRARVGLGAGIGEEGLVEAARPRQCPGEANRRLVVEEIGRAHV